ncbi:MAG: efflux RND transporter permease subunit, partial [Phycisphaerae bacterium]
MALMLIGGLIVLPQRTGRGWLPRDPLAVDALPDISENQQIIITPWSGRSPQDVEDQITYPLTTSLLGMGGVKTIRSRSMIGLSTLYVIFDDDVDFYWARARILEKLSSLPNNLLPAEAVPSIGPESTGLGQIFWYAIEAVDEEGRPTGGWDLDEL